AQHSWFGCMRNAESRNGCKCRRRLSLRDAGWTHSYVVEQTEAALQAAQRETREALETGRLIQRERDELRQSRDEVIAQGRQTEAAHEQALADIKRGTERWYRQTHQINELEQRIEQTEAALRQVVEHLRPLAALVHPDGVEAPYPDEFWVPA